MKATAFRGGQVQWHMSITPALERLRQEHGGFEANLSCVTRTCFRREEKRGGCGEAHTRKVKGQRCFKDSGKLVSVAVPSLETLSLS